jgi:hypothetical protein
MGRNPFNSLNPHRRRERAAACRTFQPGRLGSLEVDRQFILGRRPHRQIGGLLALEDAIDRATLTERQV